MPEAGPSARAQAVLWAIGVALYAGYAWALPFVLTDEGYLYYLAAAVADGQAPFRDFHLQSYMPGLFYAFSGPVSLAGSSLLLPRLAMVPWLALTPVLAWRCAARLVPTAWAAAIAVTLLLVPGPWTKFYVAGLSLLALEAGLDLLERPGGRVALRAGAVVGLSLGLRIDVALVAAALVALSLVLRPAGGRGHASVRVVGGAALAWAPFLVLLSVRGVVADHLRQLAGFAPDILRRARLGTSLAPPALPWDGPASAFAVLFHASLVVLLAFAVSIGFARARAADAGRDDRDRRRRVLLLAWAALSAPPYMWERPDVPHFTQRAACFLLPLAVLAHDAWRARATAGTWRQATALTAAAACGVFLAAYVLMALGRPDGGTVSALWLPRRAVRLSNGVSYWMAPHAMPPEMLERVLAGTRPGEPVAAVPYYPGVNYLVRRPLPGRYVFLVPHVVTSADVDQACAAELARARYVVYLPGQTMTGTSRGLLPAYAPRVAGRLREDYEVDMDRDGFTLLRRIVERRSR